MKENGWIGVDFDATLATYDGWKGDGVLGEPIPLMVNRVKQWLADGKTVKIMTARAAGDDEGINTMAIQTWCQKNIGQVLEVTNIKDQGMEELWDDRAVRVVANTGLISDGTDVDEPLDIAEPGDIGAVM
jgi:hypothetical protein